MAAPKTLAEVLEALPEEERIILTLSYLRGMSAGQIATLISCIGPECEILTSLLSKHLAESPRFKRSLIMAAMKPRTGDGPMEVTKEARSLVMRIPLEGGGRLVVELNPTEANNLSAALEAAVALIKK
jgi:hypothetical protein